MIRLELSKQRRMQEKKIQNIGNHFKLEKGTKQSKRQQLETLGTFWTKKKIITNQENK